jgi:hypothetical protein
MGIWPWEISDSLSFKVYSSPEREGPKLPDDSGVVPKTKWSFWQLGLGIFSLLDKKLVV